MLKATDNGTKYLTEPEVAMIARPIITIDTLEVRRFLAGLDPTFPEYLNDGPTAMVSDKDGPFAQLMSDAEVLTKFAGQLDYLSFGAARTKNADAQRYFDHLLAEKHGNVLEMSQFVFLCWGISRSCTHEIVRHRAGFAYSQVSQRYVGGNTLRFVERPEYQDSLLLHQRFEARIDVLAKEYEETTDLLASAQHAGNEILAGDSKTELRKRVRGAARSVLPNETEAPIMIGANIRAWRYFIEQRAHPAAEIEIRRLAFLIYEHLAAEIPLLLHDYKPAKLRDGTWCIETNVRKV